MLKNHVLWLCIETACVTSPTKLWMGSVLEKFKQKQRFLVATVGRTELSCVPREFARNCRGKKKKRKEKEKTDKMCPWARFRLELNDTKINAGQL